MEDPDPRRRVLDEARVTKVKLSSADRVYFPDGTAFFFTSDRTGSLQIYEATAWRQTP